MSNAIDPNPMSLREILYEFSVAKEVPDAELLDEFVRLYPEQAEVLTNFAIDLVVDSLGTEEVVETAFDAATVSPAVSRAMSRFQNALHANRAEDNQTIEHAAQAMAAENPFAELDRTRFRSLARDLNVNSVFLCKLRDRQIDPTSITGGFRQFVAEKMKVSVEFLTSFLVGGAPRVELQFYKADQKPEPAIEQSFEDAVRSSGLSNEQQRFLMEL